MINIRAREKRRRRGFSFYHEVRMKLTLDQFKSVSVIISLVAGRSLSYRKPSLPLKLSATSFGDKTRPPSIKEERWDL